MGVDLPAKWLGIFGVLKDTDDVEPIRPSSSSPAEYREQFELLCKIDWAAIDPQMGDIQSWPYSLRTMIIMIFKSQTPKCVIWGAKLTRIYNTAYRVQLAGESHPYVMGKSLHEHSLNILDKDEDPVHIVEEVKRTGEPILSPQRLLFKSSKACILSKEETYLSFDVLPAYDDNSEIAGVVATYYVNTQQVLGARRGTFLRSIVEAGQETPTFTRLRIKLQSAFMNCGEDWPMIMIYLRTDCLEGEALVPESKRDASTFRYFVQVGVKAHQKERMFDLTGSSGSLVEKYALKAHEQKSGITFEHPNLDDICMRRAHGMTSKQARITPVYNDADGEMPFAYIFLTFSPVRPVDEQYTDYARSVEHILSTQLSTIRRTNTSRKLLADAEHSRQFGEKFFKIVDDSPIGICLQNWATNDVSFGNHSFREIFGLPATGEEMLNSWPDCVHPEDLPGAFEVLSKLKVGERMKDHKMRLLTSHTNGKPKWINVNCTFHSGVDKDNQVVTYMASAVTDISEGVYAQEREVEVALEKERLHAAQKAHEERANEADRAKARQLEYIDVLSHEIRNPISAIVQTVEVINANLQKAQCKCCNDDEGNEIRQIIEDLGTIEICTTHMGRVINDALNVSRLEHGSLSINVQACDLLAHIKSILRMLQQEMKNKGITCPEIEIDKSWSDHVKCVKTDPLRYKQVLLNLLTNSIKFTALKQGTREIKLRLFAKPQADSKAILSCAITDSGKGMTEQAVSRLFGKFEQESARTHVNYGGSGLGLFISQRLAHLLGGDISVSSEVGIGSTFVFSIHAETSDIECCGNSATLDKENSDTDALRLAVADLERESSLLFQTVNVPSRAASRSPPPILKKSTSKNDITILVVEDNLINQKLLVKQLRMAGYNVLVGNHGAEALDHFKAGTAIDLVLTDIEMPVLNGLDFLAAVRSLDSHRVDPPFIACSAYAREEQRQAFLTAGMVDVIAKPYRFADLKKTVERTIREAPKLIRHGTY